MRYLRPEVMMLGTAAEVIQLFNKGGVHLETRIPTLPLTPVYDLDE